MTPELTEAEVLNHRAGIDATETDRLNRRADELGKLDAEILRLKDDNHGLKLELKAEREFSFSLEGINEGLRGKISELEMET